MEHVRLLLLCMYMVYKKTARKYQHKPFKLHSRVTKCYKSQRGFIKSSLLTVIFLNNARLQVMCVCFKMATYTCSKF